MQQKHLLWKRRSFIVTLCACMLGFGLVGYLLYLGYQATWTGFSVPACSANQQCPSNKTLWDWLQLFIVPLALTGAGLWFSQVQKKTELEIAQKQKEAEQENTEKRYLNDQQIAKDKQREDLLQSYLDRMSDLLLKEGLRTSKPDSELRNVARVRTLTVLNQLDTRRKGYVLSFLHESQLIGSKSEECIITFRNADLSEADLQNIDLSYIDFQDADLTKANLSNSRLRGANLEGANLQNANLENAILTEANLTKANLTNANLHDAFLHAANVSHANLTNADLSEAELRDTNFYFTDLTKANLHYAELRSLSKTTNFAYTTFSKANLSYADCKEVDFIGARFDDANLQQTYFAFAHLRDADLQRANLHKACLRGANLRDADFSNSNLEEAEFGGANFKGTELTGANLNKVKLFCPEADDTNIHEALGVPQKLLAQLKTKLKTKPS